MNDNPISDPEGILTKIPALNGIPKSSVQDRFIQERELSDLIINCLPGIFYLQDQHGKYLRWNKNFEIASGYSGEEIGQMHPLDFLDKQDHDHMNAAVRKVYKKGFNETEAEVVAKTQTLSVLPERNFSYLRRQTLPGGNMDRPDCTRKGTKRD
jgi:PAS domain-containing protein